MVDLLGDWKRAKNGEKFDRSHFLTLFTEENVQENLGVVFNGFSTAEEMAKRTQEAVFARRESPPAHGRPESLVKEAVNEHSAILEFSGLDALAKSIRAAPIEKASLDRVRQVQTIGLGWQSDVVGEIGDVFDDQLVGSSDLTYHLVEALYGIGNTYIIPQYVMADEIGFPVGGTNAFELWRRRIEMAYEDRRVIFAFKDKQI